MGCKVNEVSYVEYGKEEERTDSEPRGRDNMTFSFHFQVDRDPKRNFCFVRRSEWSIHTLSNKSPGVSI